MPIEFLYNVVPYSLLTLNRVYIHICIPPQRRHTPELSFFTLTLRPGAWGVDNPNIDLKMVRVKGLAYSPYDRMPFYLYFAETPM